jgi:hypothetical protein
MAAVAFGQLGLVNQAGVGNHAHVHNHWHTGMHSEKIDEAMAGLLHGLAEVRLETMNLRNDYGRYNILFIELCTADNFIVVIKKQWASAKLPLIRAWTSKLHELHEIVKEVVAAWISNANKRYVMKQIMYELSKKCAEVSGTKVILDPPVVVF